MFVQCRGDHDLLHETQQKPADPAAHIGPGRDRKPTELGQQVARALDGPGHQLGEEGDEQGEGEGAALRSDAAAVHVEGVAQGLECIKTDPHRHDHLQGKRAVRHVERIEQGRRGFHKEACVLEIDQQAEVCGQRTCKPNLAAGATSRRRNLPRCHKIDGRRRPQDQQKPRIEIAIKQVARRQQHGLPDPQMPHRKHSVHEQKYGQPQQEIQRVEQHHFRISRRSSSS